MPLVLAWLAGCMVFGGNYCDELDSSERERTISDSGIQSIVDKCNPYMTEGWEGSGYGYSDLVLISDSPVLSEECKEDLLSLVPQDDALEDSESAREALASGLHALLFLPVATDGTLAGTGDACEVYLGDVLGCAEQENLSEYRVVAQDEYKTLSRVNASGFRFVVERVAEFAYSASLSDADAAAYIIAEAGPSSGLITLGDGFIDQSYVEKAAVLLHEARHLRIGFGNAALHKYCYGDQPNVWYTGVFACDEDPSGAYGLGMHYFDSVIRGSGSLVLDDGRFLLPESHLKWSLLNVCYGTDHLETPGGNAVREVFFADGGDHDDCYFDALGEDSTTAGVFSSVYGIDYAKRYEDEHGYELLSQFEMTARAQRKALDKERAIRARKTLPDRLGEE